MGKKKIEKAPKTPKAAEDHNEPEPDDEPKQEPEPEKEKVEPTKPGKKGKGKPAKQAGESKATKEVELFPQDFLKKVDDFKAFYRSYLQLKATSEDVDLAGEFKNVSDKVKSKISEACARVLKDDVSDAEKWIDSKKSALQDQIKSVEDAESDTRSALSKSGTFSEAEIDKQLAGIREKKANLEKCVQDLDAIRGRASGIYKSSGMDQE